MKRSDFFVATGKKQTVITYKDAVRIEIDNKGYVPSQMVANFIQQTRTANRIIQEIMNGESSFLLAQSMVHAIANQN